MKIDVALLPQLLGRSEFECSIVIDTLRFTTTACQALSAGADAVVVGSEIDEVRRLAAESSLPTKLCGERHCKPIEGFDLGNSPWEYTDEVVRSQQLCFTTTNGTRAIEACRNSGAILLAAMVNCTAVCKYLMAQRPQELTIVCAGTEQEVSLEDSLTAGAVAAYLIDHGGAELTSDSAQMVVATWRTILEGTTVGREGQTVLEEAMTVVRSKLLERFSQAKGGRNLLQAGYKRDLEFAADFERLDCVPLSNRDQWNRFQSAAD